LVACAAALPLFAGQPDREALRKAVDSLLAEAPLASAHVGVEVQSLEDGQVVYAKNAEDLLNPASNTKLITSAAALLRLGPEYRFSTDYLADKPVQRGRVGTLYVKGRGDPSVTTERLDGLVADLWHRGVRTVGDIVLDDTFFDREQFGPGWEQETSDKAWAAGVGALSLNHNAVAIYITPANAGQRARVEVDPDARDYFVIDPRVITVRANGRRKLRPRAVIEGERTRILVEGRIPKGAEPVVMFRRVGDPTFYYGQTLKLLLKQRGIRVSGRVRRGEVPAGAVLLQTYESPELAEVVRNMNKVSSNFIAEMLVKTLGAELKGSPGTWPKGLEVAEDLLAELGLPRGTYVLHNGSGLNDTNRFSSRQMTTLLQAVWKRFPVASEFVGSLGIAARDGTMRLRMEGTDAAGRLRAKTGTLERVTALSGYVQSLGGERFAFSVLVNDWSGKTSPVVSSIDRLGVMLAAVGAPEASLREAALASLQQLSPQEAQPAELKARIATYASLAASPNKKNLPFLRSALRTERDPLLRVVLADALYRSDPEQGGGALLEALPASPDLFLRLRSVGRELSLPVPAVSSLLDLAVDGSGEALARLLALSPLARGPQHDEQLAALLSDGLLEVGEASPDEFLAALRSAPAPHADAAIELVGMALQAGDTEPDQYPLAKELKVALAQPGAPGQQLDGWLAVLENRPPPAAPAEATPAAAPAAPTEAIATVQSAAAAATAAATGSAAAAAAPALVGPPAPGVETPAPGGAPAPATAPAVTPAPASSPPAPAPVPSVDPVKPAACNGAPCRPSAESGRAGGG
jgi:D-alanyl-D-alanine carboxypeptidase/D-alanyl-D-alanine-endopeptidase (penicillin-binding protein 4)